MASILKFDLRKRVENELKTMPEGKVVAMKHVDLEVVNDLMRLFRRMEDADYRKSFAEAGQSSSSAVAEGVDCTEKN